MNVSWSRIRYKFLWIISCFLACLCHAQTLQSNSIVQFGDEGTDTVDELVIGPDGFLYITGKSTSSWSNNHTVVEPHIRGEDVVITKVNPINYSVVWATHLGSNYTGNGNYDYSKSMTIDSVGNIFVGGYTAGAFSNYSALDTEGDGYLAKFNNLGQIEWVTHEGAPGVGTVYGVCLDNQGNIYAAGSSSGSVNGESNIGDSDLFLTKYDSLGSVIWTKQFGSTDYDLHEGAVFKNNFIYTTGYVQGNVGSQLAIGARDIFISKYDTNGNQIFLKIVGSVNDDKALSIDLDNSNNIYVSGYTTGDIDGSNIGGYDCLITKLDNLGNEIWSTQYGTTAEDYISKIQVSSDCSRIYVCGRTKGNIDGSSAPDSDGDYFISWLDTAGTLLGSIQRGTSTYEYANGLALGDNGKVFLSAVTFGTLVSGQKVGYFDMVIEEFSDLDCYSPLPVNLIDFKVNYINGRVDLNWITNSEVNNDYFSLERSKDGVFFTNLSNIIATGNSNAKSYYSVSDYYPLEGISYYRLYQIDLNGDSNLLKTIETFIPINEKVSYYPNPCSKYLTVKSNLNNPFEIEIFTLQDKDVTQNCEIFRDTDGLIRVYVMNLSSGVYYLKIDNSKKRFFIE